MESSLLRKFKVIRCPLDNEVLRPRAFITHVKNHHKTYSQKWTKQVQKEESCLICTSSHFHSQPKVELAVSTRHGNDRFIIKHGTHLPTRQTPLSEIEKEFVRQKLFTSNVDIDATPPLPPPPPIAIPSPHKAIGVVENWQHLVTPEARREIEEQPNLSPTFFHILETLTPQMDINQLESSLLLDDHDPLHVEPAVAQMMFDAYKQIYEPGLHYPLEMKEQSMQVDVPSQHHAFTSTDLHAASELNDQSIQVDAPNQQHASTSMSELMDNVKKMTDKSTSPLPAPDTEDIPLLTQGVEHIREVNKMKNVMLSQIMQDNIDLLESKVQSRKRALRLMEEIFEARTQEQPFNDDISLELSRIIHLKNKFIQQLLRETARLHPQIYNMMQN